MQDLIGDLLGAGRIHTGALSVDTEAVEAAKLIEQVRTTKPHLVLLDLMLPGRDGVELMRELRERDRRARSRRVRPTTSSSRFPRRNSPPRSTNCSARAR
jgi:CheY-like chemotaxis protein